ncbi:DNA-binding NarL/FixJ family response regulator [Pontibacter aydingkolensis]|uniref:response regulator transcription factor n=1 Tax=Pontibacter aydingkolensis TaxID=1911536 RepID=UPI001FE62269|nr:response regulator transcription factor [Pontibacter aydingkolensis]
MAIQLVLAGTPYISSQAALKMLNKVMDSSHSNEIDSITVQQLLSKRELEVLALIADGFTNAEIGDMLFTSKRTIETHRQNILEKTNSKNTASLIKYAFRHQLIK